MKGLIYKQKIFSTTWELSLQNKIKCMYLSQCFFQTFFLHLFKLVFMVKNLCKKILNFSE